MIIFTNATQKLLKNYNEIPFKFKSYPTSVQKKSVVNNVEHNQEPKIKIPKTP